MAKLQLDESLFDDKMTWDSTAEFFSNNSEKDEITHISDIDDELFEYEPLAKADVLTDHRGEAVPEGPEPGFESGIADALINLINDEWEAIQGYNNFRNMILSMQQDGIGDYTDMIAVIDEVSNEENLHVGQLQELLKKVSPNTESIAKGEDEAKEQLYTSGNEWVNGKLRVESYEPHITSDSSVTADDFDTTCTLCDIDDDM